MRTLARFVHTTILGGVFFLAPIVVLIIILAKALEYANKVLQAFVAHILATSELSPTGATMLSIVTVALVCFLAGLIAHTIVGQRVVKRLEDSVLSKVPAYEYLKQESASALGVATMTELPVVLVETDFGWQIGVQTEMASGGSSPSSCLERRIRIPAQSISCLQIAFDHPRSNWSLHSTA